MLKLHKELGNTKIKVELTIGEESCLNDLNNLLATNDNEEFKVEVSITELRDFLSDLVSDEYLLTSKDEEIEKLKEELMYLENDYDAEMEYSEGQIETLSEIIEDLEEQIQDLEQQLLEATE